MRLALSANELMPKLEPWEVSLPEGRLGAVGEEVASVAVTKAMLCSDSKSILGNLFMEYSYIASHGMPHKNSHNLPSSLPVLTKVHASTWVPVDLQMTTLLARLEKLVRRFGENMAATSIAFASSVIFGISKRRWLEESRPDMSDGRPVPTLPPPNMQLK